MSAAKVRAAKKRKTATITLSPIFNIDARGASPDLAQRLPAILREHAEKMEAEIIAKLSGRRVPPPAPISRFEKVNPDGKLVAKSDTSWVAVYDREQDLVFTRTLIATNVTWKQAADAAEALNLCGSKGWRVPTLMERFRICDHSRVNPALPVELFAKESGWEWTSTVDAESPAVYAWLVFLGYGYASRSDQGGRDHVRAVRSGQSLGLCPSALVLS